MSRIALIGGHGKIALLAAPTLIAAGHTVRSLFRNPAHEGDVSATGADAVVFDVEQADTDAIAAAIDGCDAVIWSAGAGGGSAERTYAVDRDAAIRSMDAAMKTGVNRYVMVSYIGAGSDDIAPDDSFYAYARAKADADDYLRATSLKWTIVGPGRLTLEPASGRITLVDGSHKGANDTSRANVADVLRRTLDSDASIGKTIRFIDGVTPIDEAV